jgi:hypothetical protein
MKDLVPRNEPLRLADLLAGVANRATDAHHLAGVGVDVRDQVFHRVEAANGRRQRPQHRQHRCRRKPGREADGGDAVSREMVGQVGHARQLRSHRKPDRLQPGVGDPEVERTLAQGLQERLESPVPGLRGGEAGPAAA